MLAAFHRSYDAAYVRDERDILGIGIGIGPDTPSSGVRLAPRVLVPYSVEVIANRTQRTLHDLSSS